VNCTIGGLRVIEPAMATGPLNILLELSYRGPPNSVKRIIHFIAGPPIFSGHGTRALGRYSGVLWQHINISLPPKPQFSSLARAALRGILLLETPWPPVVVWLGWMNLTPELDLDVVPTPGILYMTVFFVEK